MKFSLFFLILFYQYGFSAHPTHLQKLQILLKNTSCTSSTERSFFNLGTFSSKTTLLNKTSWYSQQSSDSFSRTQPEAFLKKGQVRFAKSDKGDIFVSQQKKGQISFYVYLCSRDILEDQTILPSYVKFFLKNLGRKNCSFKQHSGHIEVSLLNKKNQYLSIKEKLYPINFIINTKQEVLSSLCQKTIDKDYQPSPQKIKKSSYYLFPIGKKHYLLHNGGIKQTL